MPGIRLFDVRAALAALGLAGLAALAVAIATHMPAPAVSGLATHATSPGLSRLQSLPLQAQSVISSTIGGDARAFAAHRTDGGWQLSGGGVRADFRSGAPTLTVAGGTLALSLTGFPASTSVTARGNRVTLDRAGVREWYAAGPLGVEQGFTLTRRLEGKALTLGVSGGLRPRMSSTGITFVGAHGQAVLRYGGLTTVDARGHQLPSSLAVRDGNVVISVNDAGSRYPITVDPLVQQGKLVPDNLKTNGSGSAFGFSVALSGDGNTALIGAKNDDSGKGGAWIFSRTGSTWSQGQKIGPPTDVVTPPVANFGNSVALSTNGNTALIGGELDNGQTGAVWVYVQSAAGYVEQARMPSTAVPVTGLTGADQFGHSVALSGDGNTALVGAPDNNGTASANGGAAWVFTRAANGTWSQLGARIAPAVAPANNADNWGTAVALSRDGNTALIGGPHEGPGSGAAWVYTRGSSAFTPQHELFANPASALVAFGSSVALSSNGNTALIGAPSDTVGTGGAAWAFTRSGGSWGSGTKIVPANSPSGVFGSAVALSDDGNTALIGAQGMTPDLGAAFIFTQSGGAWLQQQILTGTGEVGFGFFGTSVALASDGQTAMIGAPSDTSETGAAFAFAPPSPVCNSVSATGPQGGGSVAIALSCTLPSGAKAAYSILGGPSNGKVTSFNASTGQAVYTSAQFFSGQDSFTYRVSDQWGVSNIATATLNIPFLPVPVCKNVTAKGKKGATKVTVTLHCTGPAGHAFSYGIVSKPGAGRLGKINQSNGKLTYTTHVGFSGTDRFVYNATNSGGSSKAATATIQLPQLGRITATMTWGTFGAGASSTTLPGMLIKSLPGGATVKLSCKGKGCPVATRTLSLPKHKVCKGKGRKRKCKLAPPKSANLDLSRYVAHRHVKVGYQVIVSMVQSGSIGKQYVFTMRKSAQPGIKIQTLAPGSSTKLCPNC